MHRFSGLPENLADFCAFLRSEYAFQIGPGDLIDACRTLEVVDLLDQQAVRAALRAVLTGTREEAEAFDAAFARFFLWPSPARPAGELPAVHPDWSDSGSEGPGGEEAQAGTRTADAETEGHSGGTAAQSVPGGTRDDDARSAAWTRYSPLEGSGHVAPDLPDVDDAWRAAARVLVRRARLGLSRRWRIAPKGQQFDFRRTLRSSLQTGGELLRPRWRARQRRTARFVVLIDGSRSMGMQADMALHVASALAATTPRVEVFTFSTTLRRITGDIRRAAGRTGRLPRLASAWGGGTRIGACLTEYLRQFGDRLRAADTVVIVMSDGLDVGELDVLQSSMRTLHRRSAAVVWLNPLINTPGYEPTAAGIRTIRSFITTFSDASDPANFTRLARSVRFKS